MTFASIVNENVTEEYGVKVSFENEIRRASFTSTSYAALLELVAKLFEIDPASAVLKYQDEDDKVTMSTDGEFKDAIRLAKAEKKTLRLFVEMRTAEVKAEVRSGEQLNAFSGARFPWKHGPFPGPFPHGRGYRGHYGYHGHNDLHGLHGHHSPQFGSVSEDPNLKQSAPPSGSALEVPNSNQPPLSEPASKGHGLPPFVHPHHRFGHEGHHRFGHEGHGHPHPRFGVGHPPFHGPFNPADAPFFHRYGAPSMFAHGTFSPADSTPTATATPATFERESQSPYAARCDFKERKQAMKETLRAMKANASTPEDAQAIREFKENMRAECKGRWKGCRFGQLNSDRLVAKHVADVTIPDNSELPADTPVTKTWKLKNAGTTAWPANSQLIFVSRHGDNLNGPERVEVKGPILPQQEVEVSVTFITPSEPGRYIGYYRMATSDGAKFGQRVWVSFVIPYSDRVPKEAGATVAEPLAATATAAAPEPFAETAGDVTTD